MTCINCGFENLPTDRHCIRCRFPMPVQEKTPPPPKFFSQTEAAPPPQPPTPAAPEILPTAQKGISPEEKSVRAGSNQPVSNKGKKICPQCHYELVLDSDTCPMCSFQLGKNQSSRNSGTHILPSKEEEKNATPPTAAQPAAAFFPNKIIASPPKITENASPETTAVQPETAPAPATEVEKKTPIAEVAIPKIPTPEEKLALPKSPSLSGKISDVTKSPFAETKKPRQASNTVDPYRRDSSIGQIAELRPIARDGEKAPETVVLTHLDKPLSLDRALLEPENNTITSRVQAEIEFRDGAWYIVDRSEQQTTFVRATGPVRLRKGDIILMGNRKFEFDG